MLVLATANPHKVNELKSILAQSGIPAAALSDVLGPDGTPLPTSEPIETGATFEENAILKARSYAIQTRRAVLADDSGLEIDALGGRPGVISSHYSTDGIETGTSREARDRANNERVLRELEPIPFERRTARFVCVMALALPPHGGEGARIVAVTRGVFEGRIGLPRAGSASSDRWIVPRGREGFGYDPLFLVGPAFESTSAELSQADKNSLSHRGAAARAMAAEIRRGLPDLAGC